MLFVKGFLYIQKLDKKNSTLWIIYQKSPTGSSWKHSNKNGKDEIPINNDTSVGQRKNLSPRQESNP